MRKRERGWYWPWLVTAALSFTVGVNVVMLFAASGDGGNGYVVEPDYYRKAVDWDATMARQASSDALGWRATTSIARATADSAGLVVQVTDRTGLPLEGARFTAVLLHNSDAGHPLHSTLVETAAGRYEAMMPLVHDGRWEVRLEARRDADRFMSTQHAESSALTAN